MIETKDEVDVVCSRIDVSRLMQKW